MLDKRPLVPLPDRMAHLPLHQGLPVMYTVAVEAGAVDFRLTDARKSQRCMRQRLCAICGTKLGNWGTLVLGQHQVDLKAYNSGEPLMHEGCLRYALTVCPFLAGKTARRPTNLPEDVYLGGERIQRVERRYIGWTRDYHTVMHDGVLCVVIDHLHRMEEVL